MTATFAGPPDAEPTNEFATSTKNAPIPVFSKNEPKMVNALLDQVAKQVR